MGWIGIFNWETGEKNVDILRREFFDGNDKWEELASSSKGGHVWFLFRNKETGYTAASVTMCKRFKDHEFCYKEMGLDCGPNFYDMPKNWLNMIDKSYFNDKYSAAWIEKFKSPEDKKAGFPIWSKVPDGTNFICTFGCDTTSGHKKGDAIKAYWRDDIKSLSYGLYRVSKNKIKKIFSEVKVVKE